MAKKRRSKKVLIGVATLIIVVVILFVSLQGSNSHETVVQADLAIIDDISEIVTASGRIQPQTKVDITAEVSAQIIELFVGEGDHVNRGQNLVLLDTVQLKTDVAQARFSLDEITARTDVAWTQYEKDSLEFIRQYRLFERNLISETAHTNARLAFEGSRASYTAMMSQVKIGHARLQKVEDNLAKTMIRAPMDGIITFLNAEVGEVAQAQTSYTQGKILMTIADLSVFEVEVDVDETEIAKVRIGQPAKIRIDAFRDTSFAGNVVEISNSVRIQGQGTDDYSTNFQVKIRFAQTVASVRPGMSATADITTATVEEALLIPYASVILREFDKDSLDQVAGTPEPNGDSGEQAAVANNESGGGDPENNSPGTFRKKEKVKKSGVFIIRNGLAEFCEVTTGIADDLNVAVLSGVNPGDTVISGTFKTLRDLSEGETVRIDDNSLEKIQEESES